MRYFNEWELRELQLELQQLDEDFVELDNFFDSEAFICSNDYVDTRAVGERNDEQMLMERFFID